MSSIIYVDTDNVLIMGSALTVLALAIMMGAEALKRSERDHYPWKQAGFVAAYMTLLTLLFAMNSLIAFGIGMTIVAISIVAACLAFSDVEFSDTFKWYIPAVAYCFVLGIIMAILRGTLYWV